jgi:hypothetical protein
LARSVRANPPSFSLFPRGVSEYYLNCHCVSGTGAAIATVIFLLDHHNRSQTRWTCIKKTTTGFQDARAQPNIFDARAGKDLTCTQDMTQDVAKNQQLKVLWLSHPPVQALKHCQTRQGSSSSNLCIHVVFVFLLHTIRYEPTIMCIRQNKIDRRW